ncbi:hypothetical protein WME77_36860 [Sorangium sp. So ce764]|uniref:hypothetical protein n=1 Tax=Sorangium sp. So ce764 TaxID=3133320 RepID=UPI003F5DC337
MGKPLGVTMLICALSAPWSGCSVEMCPVVKEPGCDLTDPDHECRDVCVGEVRMDDHEADDDAREPDAAEDDDGPAGGQPSDETADANKG